MSGAAFCIDGIAFWAPRLPGWPLARAAFRGEAEPLEAAVKRPAPEILAAAERRRAPDSVALALEVAAAAAQQAGLAPSSLPSVFCSALGDLAVNDYMCRTLAEQPAAISPTKFHNSVHNAAAGYWTIGTACREASTALAAYDASFAAGLLEAALQCAADERPVLLVACDVEAVGPLASVTSSSGLLACALVLSPAAGERSRAAFDWSLVPGRTAGTATLRSAAARSLAGNAMADALPFFESLARDDAELPALRLGASLSLALRRRPVAA